MTSNRIGDSATVDRGLPVAPSMSHALTAASAPKKTNLVDLRVVQITVLSMLIAAAAALIAQVLMHLIWFITGLSFHGRLTIAPQSPLENHLGLWVIGVPAVGGIIVGFMARYGSAGIRGHGIPEAMEHVLQNQSRIPPRLTFLKPLSSAIAIGTGGPFGAEGPIIATGGALGSLVGQILRTTAMERKTLLAAGAAAGMAATFGAPVSAVLLAMELLLFEFRARSIIPVTFASVTATGVRWAFEGTEPVFSMPDLQQATGGALSLYILIGAIVGVASVLVTRLVYAIEDGFERLPIHWMWWPALGGLVVGLVGYFFPKTLGVGYENISDVLSGGLAIAAVGSLALWKLVSWSVSLGSGTSGGTLAPLFTIGGALGALLGMACEQLVPGASIDLRIAALVGMAAMFAGASRALLASVVFAFETTLQPLGLLPLLGGCSASFLISALLMRNTIMTEKIARRGVLVPAEYEADFLNQILVREVASSGLVTLHADQSLAEVRRWIGSNAPGSSHQGFPVLGGDGMLVSVLTRRTLLDPGLAPETRLADLPMRPPVFVYADNTLRDAADHMVRHGIGRLPVFERETRRLVAMVTRSDILGAHSRRLHETDASKRQLGFRGVRLRNRSGE